MSNSTSNTSTSNTSTCLHTGNNTDDFFWLFLELRREAEFKFRATAVQVYLLVLSTGVLLLLAVLLGSKRRRSKSVVLKAVLWASYNLTTYLIGYTMGLVLHIDKDISPYLTGRIILWAMFLMIAFGSADSFSAFNRIDNEQWKRYNWQFVLKIGTLMILVFRCGKIFMLTVYQILFPLIFLAMLLKGYTKNQSLATSSRHSLRSISKLIVEYMSLGHEAEDMQQIDPMSMKGYRYLVLGEEAQILRMKTQGFEVTQQVVTLDKVWNCKGKLLSSGHGGDRLKDMCLSFSFFKLLHCKYAGYKLPRGVHQKMLHLILHGLMLSEENCYERPFRVVEEELGLLFDLFYTKRSLIFQPHGLYIRFAEFLLIGLLSSFLIRFLIPTSNFWTIREYFSSWIILVFPKLVIVATFLVAESTQFFLLLFTTWAKVTCICQYVKHKSWQTSRLKVKCIDLICRLPSPKPWERKLHQYSLLECYTYSPCKLLSNKFALMFIDWARDGQKECDPINLSEEVKKAVFVCLKNTLCSDLENGDNSLRQPNVSSELSWACRLEVQSEVIMVWHIATTMCESEVKTLDSSECRKNFQVAISLSKYLTYLVAFAPRLLPDHSDVTESLFDEMIVEARHLLKGYKTVEERINKLKATPEESGCETTLTRGAKLGKQLLVNKGELDVVWETLADFWAKMMLYVAPSEDAEAHAEGLANGGEFVTHLWALLYHAGIEREGNKASTDRERKD